jgi:hypothetical protein
MPVLILIYFVLLCGFGIPDQEKLQGVDENEKGVIKDQSVLFDDDHPRQRAGTRDHNQDEHRGGQVSHFFCPYRLGELGDAGEHACGGANPVEEL